MEKEVSCINTKVILDYVKKYNNSDCSAILGNLDPEIDSLDDPATFLTDPNNWVPTGVIVKLFERIRNISKDDRIAFKIAKFAVENSALGYIQKIFVKAFWSSKKGFKHVQEINSKFNRNKKVELVEIKRNGAIVRLHWDSIMGPSKDLCLYNQGMYSFLPTIWLGKPVQLEEKCCNFEEALYCEYHIKWQ